MKILAVNAGSSSLKIQLIEMPEEKLIAKALIERIGKEDAIVTIKYNVDGIEKVFRLDSTPILSHMEAVKTIVDRFQEFKIIENANDIKGVGHRIVQGGEYFDKTVVVDDDVSKKVLELAELAPHHNKAEHDGYVAFKKCFPNAIHTMVFDTAFHQSIEEEKYIYPLPYKYYTDYKVRRYGAHGTSHKYIASVIKEYYGHDENTISCHLGSGASLCAIKDGKSIDTSMGFTPLGGIMMGTRCGDLDPSILFYIMNKENLSPDEMNHICNFKSGLLGVSNFSDSMKQVDEQRLVGNNQANLAFNLYCNRTSQFIGSYFVELGGAKCIVFTAGVGENSTNTRKTIISKIKDALQIEIDEDNPEIILNGKGKKISTKNSKIDVFVIPTNEELMMCRDTYEIVKER